MGLFQPPHGSPVYGIKLNLSSTIGSEVNAKTIFITTKHQVVLNADNYTQLNGTDDTSDLTGRASELTSAARAAGIAAPGAHLTLKQAIRVV